ncbi:MAG TPA: beta-propeller domain-containing protein, partial [Labilithrix sp.]|nr:beta-propeller domain-containing protein [Labilithrix sp.]
MRSRSCFVALSSLTVLASVAPALAGCSSSEDIAARNREEGQTEFESAPPVGQGGGSSFGSAERASASDSNAAPTAPTAPGANGATAPQAKPEETDIYRVDGDRLYFLNSYRGLMVFDVANPDDPKLLGRSPVYGTPVEMFVRDGIATMVVGDWYGNAPDGSPFHGSVVRTIDARDPANMKVQGEVQVKGWARDMRVVGQNLFIVSEDYGWFYGLGYRGIGMASGDVAISGPYGQGGTSKVVISSVSFGDFAPKLNGTKEFDGYSGAFNVTSDAILLAHDVLADGQNGYKQATGKSALDFIAFSQSDGSIVPMGTATVDGTLNGWSADNGRWNIDLDGSTASVLTCSTSPYGYCDGQGGYRLTTIDFSNPSDPKQLAALDIASKGWAATARFSNKRMYLSPREGIYTNNGTQLPTPVEIYDLSSPATPQLAGSTNISGAVWLFMPAGTDRLFVLGNEYGNGYSSSKVALRLLDVSDASKPTVLGTSTFGDGWAWTPAAGTFKAFTRDENQKLVVLPFSGWSPNSQSYMNGVQLIEYDTGSITTKGSARSKGWVERGVFVKNRLVSLSDQSLNVIDYSDRATPKVIKEMTLARNVVSAEPNGATIAQLSTDWYGYDNQSSELRVLPIANAEENVEDPNAKSISVDGTNARIFRNGDLAYVVTTLYPKNPQNGPWYTTPHVQVIDLANGGAARLGSIDLPQDQGSSWSWWGGCYYWDWYDGSNAVQVGGDALAFRRTQG